MSPATRLAYCYVTAGVLVVAGVATWTVGGALVVAGLLVAAAGTAVLRDWTPEESER